MADLRMLWNLDVRVRDRNLKAGVLKREDVQKHLDGLPDAARNAELLTIRQPGFAGEDEMDTDVRSSVDSAFSLFAVTARGSELEGSVERDGFADRDEADAEDEDN